MWEVTRRDFLRSGVAAAAAAVAAHWKAAFALAQAPLGERPEQAAGVEVLHPRGRVPLSFFIDDSTCLVNMGHFCMPQFAEAWPDREIYQKPWKTWPREIPDAFVRRFAEFCAAHGVKGKYSLVPYPCLVGWLDRELPGWSRRELLDSLKLVREMMLPNWDVHPEMITHTRVIDLKTGRPLEEISSATMENSYPRTPKSVDELAAYLAYALRILKNCELPCEGITTPGGFGNLVKSELSLAVQQAVRDVYGTEIPHYFKYVSGGTESTEPKLEHASGLEGDDPRVTVNLPAGTGDWFGNWDGDGQPEGFRYANSDASEGRMVELIERGQPAVMLCHWPGLYTHGSEEGFKQLKQVILALEGRFREQTIWMKISEMARYWAAKGLTRIGRKGLAVTLAAPFASPDFTLRISSLPAQGPLTGQPRLVHNGKPTPLREVSRRVDLASGTWLAEKEAVVVCFDLPKGVSAIEWQ